MLPLVSLSRACGPFPCSTGSMPTIVLCFVAWLSLLNEDNPAGLISTPSVTGAAGDPRGRRIITGGFKRQAEEGPNLAVWI